MIRNTDLIEALIPIVREAGRTIMRYWRSGPETRLKADGSPVTEADRTAQTILLDGLTRLAPDLPVISEEDEASHTTTRSPRFALVDPLDGTREFAKADGSGDFTVNIGIIERGRATAGIIYAPVPDRLFLGCAGQGAAELTVDGRRPIHVRQPPAKGLTALTSRSHLSAETRAWLTARGITRTRTLGSSLKLCLLAAGEADLYPRFGPTMEWDTAAGDGILRAAGGRVLTPDGSALAYGKAGYRNGPFIGLGDLAMPPPGPR